MTSRYKNSCFPDATSSWNNIISNFQESPTFAGLKSHLLSLIRPKIKSTFGIHDALGSLSFSIEGKFESFKKQQKAP